MTDSQSHADGSVEVEETSAGSFGEVGTSRGKARAPALYAEDGNGASYAARSAGLNVRRVPCATIRPIGNSGEYTANARQSLNARPGSRSPLPS